MRAKKEFGQHFLVQESIAEKLADALQPSGVEAIIEVGPGKGILTQYLLRQPLPLYAVELDRDMIPILQKTFSGTPLHIVQGDILSVRIDDIVGAETNFIVVGNFPYNISSQIVFLCLQYRSRVPFMAGMFQREMASRICSPPGSKEFGVISVLVQAYYRPEFLFAVKPGSFNPPPKVQSSVISLTRYRSEIEGLSFQQLRRVVKIAFSQRRKKIRNTLKDLIPEDTLRDLQVVDMRPEQLTVEQFIILAKHALPAQPT